MSRRGRRGQSMVEFAMVAPVLVAFFLGIVDLGRAMYVYSTIQQAATEGARVASVGYNSNLPRDADVEAAVKQKAAGVALANPCPNGPINTAQTPPGNSGWIFITQVPPPSTVTTTAPTPATAPGGESLAPATASCSAVNPAYGNQQLQVTIRYTFVPITPIISQLVGNSFVITANAVYRTEY